MHNDSLISVADHPNLKRDIDSGAIIDVDIDAFSRYQTHRESKLAANAKLSQLEDRINNFESDLSDIKSLLTRLLEK